jgi:hypothetical protein
MHIKKQKEGSAMKKRPIHTLVTHRGEHLDEIVAIYLLRKEGADLFPGIEKAKIQYCANGGFLPEGKTEEDLEKEGILYIGVGKGRFDDHDLDGNLKEGKCSALLVAEFLGIDDDPIYEELLDYTLRNDRKGAGHTFDLAHLLKVAHEQYPDNPEKIYKWVTDGINFHIVQRTKFCIVTKNNYEELLRQKKIRFYYFPCSDIAKIKVMVVESDDTQIAKYCRSKKGGCADIVVQVQPSGNIQIFSNKRKIKLEVMDDIVQMIRLAEQKASKKVVNTDWNKLAAEGQVDGCLNWYYHRSCRMMLNGSLSHPDTPPTKIPLNDLLKIIRIGVDLNCFDSKRQSQCKKGICTSTKDSPCPFYNAGLHRCRVIRYYMKKYNKN